MQTAIRTDAQRLERMVSTLPISGSMAAFANWNSMKLPEKISSGRRRAGLRRLDSGRCGGFSGWPPWARSGSTSLVRIYASETSAGTSSTAVTKNTARFDIQ